jgi:hypothetical protein
MKLVRKAVRLRLLALLARSYRLEIPALETFLPIKVSIFFVVFVIWKIVQQVFKKVHAFQSILFISKDLHSKHHAAGFFKRL